MFMPNVIVGLAVALGFIAITIAVRRRFGSFGYWAFFSLTALSIVAAQIVPTFTSVEVGDLLLLLGLISLAIVGLIKAWTLLRPAQ